VFLRLIEPDVPGWSRSDRDVSIMVTPDAGEPGAECVEVIVTDGPLNMNEHHIEVRFENGSVRQGYCWKDPGDGKPTSIGFPRDEFPVR
jgi:hypothetical protein